MELDRVKEFFDVQRLTTMVVEFLPRLGAAIALFLLFLLLYRASRRPLSAILRRADLDRHLVDLLVENLYKYTLLIIGLIMSVDQLGIDVTTALAGIGVAGIALGFAAQDSVANVISGILIFWDKPFVVNDWIETEGQYGCVSNITLRTTRIRTPRNTYVVIPNKRIIDEVLENFSKHGALRVDVPVGIAYKEDVRKAQEVLLGAVDSLPGLCEDREPDVVVVELGDSSVNLMVRVWIETAAKQRPTFVEVLERSKIALDEAGIEIPFPHLQLFVDDVKKPVWEQARRLAATAEG